MPVNATPEMTLGAALHQSTIDSLHADVAEFVAADAETPLCARPAVTMADVHKRISAYMADLADELPDTYTLTLVARSTVSPNDSVVTTQDDDMGAVGLIVMTLAGKIAKQGVAYADVIVEPVAPKQPCRSPYCECSVGECRDPDRYDARGEVDPVVRVPYILEPCNSAYCDCPVGECHRPMCFDARDTVSLGG